jgi:hypothetical protein
MIGLLSFQPSERLLSTREAAVCSLGMISPTTLYLYSLEVSLL